MKANNKDGVDPLMTSLPHHLLVIPDGDRTFASKHGMSLEDAYMVAGEQLLNVMRWIHLGLSIPNLTLFALAEYNLTRPVGQVRAILQAGAHFLRLLNDDPILEKVKVRFIGELERYFVLQPQCEPLVQEIQGKRPDTNMQTNLLIAYSGERDLERAVQQCIGQSKEPPNYEHIRQCSSLPIPIDMIIRTAGHSGFRLSGVFLGIEQARMYSIKALFPELTDRDIKQAIRKYSVETERLLEQGQHFIEYLNYRKRLSTGG